MVFFTENDMLRQENFRLRLENQHLISNIARASKEIAHLKKTVENFRNRGISLERENQRLLKSVVALKTYVTCIENNHRMVSESKESYQKIAKKLQIDLEKKNKEVQVLRDSEKPLRDEITKLFLLMDDAKTRKFDPSEVFRARHMLIKPSYTTQSIEMTEFNPLLQVLMKVTGAEFGTRVKSLLEKGKFGPRRGTFTSSLIFADFVFDVSPISEGKLELTVRELEKENLQILNKKVVHFRRSKRTISL